MNIPRDSHYPIPNQQNQNMVPPLQPAIPFLHPKPTSTITMPPNRSTTQPKTKPKPKPKPEAIPQNHQAFDPWNSISTGHQRAENPYSSTVGWKEVRAGKLAKQFGRGPDTDDYNDENGFGAVVCYETDQKHHPSRDDGEWRYVSEAEARRIQLGVSDIRCFMGVGKRKAGTETQSGSEKKVKRVREGEGNTSHLSTGSQSMPSPSSSTVFTTTNSSASANASADTNATANTKSTLFSGTTIYINGSTLPHISDHKLKHLLVSHGARISIAMARKSVTHVIVGQPNIKHISPSTSTGASSTTKAASSTTTGVTSPSTTQNQKQALFKGAGGGLAARKLQQEIARGGWRGVKVVSVEWYIPLSYSFHLLFHPFQFILRLAVLSNAFAI